MVDQQRIEQVQKDELTGFPQRWDLYSFLEKLIVESGVKGKRFTTVAIDLNGSNKFLDRGSLFVNEILKYTSSTLRLTLENKQCYFFRYGEKELIAVFPDKEPKEVLKSLQEIGYIFLKRPFLFENQLHNVSFRYGLASYPLDGMKKEELIRKTLDPNRLLKSELSNMGKFGDRIKSIKFNKAIVFILVIGILSVLVLLNNSNFKKAAQFITPFLDKIKSNKLFTKGAPKLADPDRVITTSGSIFEGRILAETDDKVIINLLFQKGGEGTFSLNKKEIARIDYGLKSPSQK